MWYFIGGVTLLLVAGFIWWCVHTAEIVVSALTDEGQGDE